MMKLRDVVVLICYCCLLCSLTAGYATPTTMLILQRPNATHIVGNASAPEWREYVVNSLDWNAAPVLEQTAPTTTTNDGRHTAPTTDFPTTKVGVAELMMPRAEALYYARSVEDVELAANTILSQSNGAGGTPKRIQVRSGRHSYVSFQNIAKNSSIIDVSNISHIVPVNSNGEEMDLNDAAAGTSTITHVRVGAGTRLYEVYSALSKLKVLIPGGSCPSVGVSGYTLGGGYGFSSRLFGMGSDAVTGMEIVTIGANKSTSVPLVSRKSLQNGTTTASQEDKDLLWALRGGGNNNYGIVTEITFKVSPAPDTVSFAAFSISSEDCENKGYKLFEEIGYFVDPRVTLQVDMFHNICNFLAVGYEMDEAELKGRIQWGRFEAACNTSFKPLKPTNTPSMSWIEAMRNLGGCGNDTTCMEAARSVPTFENYDMFEGMSVLVSDPISPNGASHNPTPKIQSVFKALRSPSCSCESCMCMAVLDPYGGNIARNGDTNETSFAWHHAWYSVQILGYFNATYETQVRNHVKGIYDAYVKPEDGVDTFCCEASYRNYPSQLYKNPLQRYYGKNLPALLNVKKMVDPLGVFDYSQGVGSGASTWKPTGGKHKEGTNDDGKLSPVAIVAIVIGSLSVSVIAGVVYKEFIKKKGRHVDDEDAADREGLASGGSNATTTNAKYSSV